jgi:hypothetical protein
MVQVWRSLPTIYEVFMGDTTTGRPIIDGDLQDTTHSTTADSAHRSSASPYDESGVSKAFQGGSHAHGNFLQGQSFPIQQHGSQNRQELFNMASLGTALPDIAYMNYNNASPQRYPSGPSPSAHLYHVQNITQLGGPASVNPPTTNLPYNAQYQALYQGMYLPSQGQATAGSQPVLNIGSQFYQGQAFMGQAPVSGYFMQPGQYATQSQIYTASPSMGQYGPRGSYAGDNRPLSQQRSGDYQPGSQIDGSKRRVTSIGV